MIKLENIDKYFNRFKKNQIHVINNTSLEFEDKGLVALLGPSGSGKTTLLNVIGGLDKVGKGRIYVNGRKMTSKFSYKVDKLRNLNIGYIFQDYKLVENLSVYDNVALSLKLIGIKDKKEIDKRVTYVLEKVGMYRYRKRPANMLSGGERQRVGIARAIVKNPNIIIADEPTGNLDSKNSVEIMNIIKAISRDRLVILVTHEVNLAKFYASRIIELSDGTVVKDYENKHTNELDYAIDNRFYLKDFKVEENYNDKSSNITVYSDGDSKIKLDIVVKNNNIYIKSRNDKSIEVVDEDSSIEFIDDHYKKIDKKDIDKYQFDFDEVIDKNKKLRYSSIFNPITFITNGFKKVFDYSLIKKILLGGFFLAACFITVAISMIFSTFEIHDENFVTTNKNYLTLETNKLSIEDYNKYSEIPNVSYILPGDSLVKFSFKVDDYYQTAKYAFNISGSLSNKGLLSTNDIVLGRMPENDYEIVVDSLVIDKLYKEDAIKMFGITKYSDMLDREVTIPGMKPFKIVGITSLKSPSIYVSDQLFMNILFNGSGQGDEDDGMFYGNGEKLISSGFQDYHLYTESAYLTKGRWPEGDYEVVVNVSHQEEMKLNKQINTKINGVKLTVVGYYDNVYDNDLYLVNYNTLRANLISSASKFSICTSNKTETLKYIRDNYKVNVYDNYQKEKSNYISGNRDRVNNILMWSAIILSVSLIEIFLMSRSSFLSRVKEVGVYRAIGVKKKDIYTMFAGEVIAIVTLASVPGILITSYIMHILISIPGFSSLIVVNMETLLVTLVIVYVFNLIVGLIPVFKVLFKRPAEILARTDL